MSLNKKLLSAVPEALASETSEKSVFEVPLSSAG